jgi:hypothetical protein
MTIADTTIHARPFRFPPALNRRPIYVGTLAAI